MNTRQAVVQQALGAINCPAGTYYDSRYSRCMPSVIPPLRGMGQFSNTVSLTPREKLTKCAYQCRTDQWGNLLDALACNDCLGALQVASFVTANRARTLPIFSTYRRSAIGNCG